MKRPRRVTPELLWRRHVRFITPYEARFASDYRAVMGELRGAIRESGNSPFPLDEWKRRVSSAMAPAYRAAILNGGRQFLLSTVSLRKKLASGFITKATRSSVSDVVVSLESDFRDRIEETVGTTWDALNGILDEATADNLDPDEVGDLIDEEWSDVLGRRTDSIALTETNGAVNSVRDYLSQVLVELQSWVTAQDERVRATHVIYGEAGPKPVGFDWAQLADDAGYTLRFPCDPLCHEPAEIVNCRCFVVPEGELMIDEADLEDYLADFEMDPEDLMRSEDQQAKGFVYVKGDFEGHPFRGNQYTAGEGGAEITDDVTAAYGGQINGTLRAKDKDGRTIGYLDWQQYGDKVTIAMIESSKDAQGRGVATALVNRLLADNPKARLDWGSTTPDGAKLRAKLEERIPRLREQVKREREAKDRLLSEHASDKAEYQRLIDSLRPDMPDAEKWKIGDRLNEIGDKYVDIDAGPERRPPPLSEDL